MTLTVKTKLKMKSIMIIKNALKTLLVSIAGLTFSGASLALEPVQKSQVQVDSQADVHNIAVLIEFNGTSTHVVKITELDNIKDYRPFSAANQLKAGLGANTQNSLVALKEMKQPPKGKILVTWNDGANLIDDPRIIRAPLQSDGYGHGKLTYAQSGSFIIKLTSRQTDLDKKQLMSSLSIVWPDLPAQEI